MKVFEGTWSWKVRDKLDLLCLTLTWCKWQRESKKVISAVKFLSLSVLSCHRIKLFEPCIATDFNHCIFSWYPLFYVNRLVVTLFWNKMYYVPLSLYLWAPRWQQICSSNHILLDKHHSFCHLIWMNYHSRSLSSFYNHNDTISSSCNSWHSIKMYLCGIIQYIEG